MIDNFKLDLYRKFNKDLENLDDKELIDHFHNLGFFQMRLYFEPSLFCKEKVYIFSTKFSFYISSVLRYLLFKKYIISEIVYTVDYTSPNLYIIPFPQKINKFPKNYIIYQLEQKDISKWINKKYELSILFSKKTFDYSQSNIDKFDNIIKKKMIYFPIPLIPYHYLDYKIIIPNPTNNILFYGSMNNIRRQKLIYLQQKLGYKYRIKIINNLFGKRLFDEILNSKIILNIHFYKNAILETYRLNEVLSCGKIIISEKPSEIDNNNFKLYQDKVIFINNMDEMYHQIIINLEKEFKHKFYYIPYFNSNLDFNQLMECN